MKDLEAAIDMIQKYKKYYLAGLELPVKLSKPKYFILRCVGDSCECEQRKREAIALMRSSQQ